MSHQWLRELKRGGVRSLCAIHFRIPDDEVVQFGHYGREPVRLPAAEAVHAFSQADDALGLEIIVCRSIPPREIQAIRHVPQLLGWRCFPGAHGREPCGCRACVPRGSIKSRALRERFES